MTSLLPVNATTLEQSLSEASGRLDQLAVPVRFMLDPARCPASHLPWLAWAFSVDFWDTGWTEDTKRAVIAASIAVHRRKGTVSSVKDALKAAGFGDATVIENLSANQHDGALAHDGTETYRASGNWAEYKVVMARPISIAQAEAVRAILSATAPARCHLVELDFAEASNLYDGTISNDGTFSYGVA